MEKYNLGEMDQASLLQRMETVLPTREARSKLLYRLSHLLGDQERMLSLQRYLGSVSNTNITTASSNNNNNKRSHKNTPRSSTTVTGVCILQARRLRVTYLVEVNSVDASRQRNRVDQGAA